MKVIVTDAQGNTLLGRILELDIEGDTAWQWMIKRFEKANTKLGIPADTSFIFLTQDNEGTWNVGAVTKTHTLKVVYYQNYYVRFEMSFVGLPTPEFAHWKLGQFLRHQMTADVQLYDALLIDAQGNVTDLYDGPEPMPPIPGWTREPKLRKFIDDNG